MTRLLLCLSIAFSIGLISSCSVSSQINEYNQIISPAGAGDLLTTLQRIDSKEKFRHPLVNLKYKKLKKSMNRRFVLRTEQLSNPSNNHIINDICSIYQTYWNKALLNPTENYEQELYTNIAHYLVENQLTEQSFETLERTAIDDQELLRVITDQGYYAKFLKSNGIQDLIIWDKQSHSKYAVQLPNQFIDVNVMYIEHYVLKGVSAYASFNHSSVGGWAESEDSSLFCNKGAYRLGSEKFRVSYLKHESIHFIDLRNYPNLESADLEYRAKLIELTYCTNKTIYHRINEFISTASESDRDYSHPFANYYLIHHLSKRLFGVNFETDINKWKTIEAEIINAASRKLFEESSAKLNANPQLNRIL